MSVNAATIALIKQYEGVKLTAYLCPAGVPTIGVGHTGSDVTPGDVKRRTTITESHAMGLLQADLAKFERDIAGLVRVPLTENQRGALVSLCYNIGAGNFGSSTLLKVLNAGRYDLAEDQFARWNRGGGRVLPGLVARRAAEAKLFGTP